MQTFEAQWLLMVSLRLWLGDRGYELVESRGPEGMFQGLDRYRGRIAEVAITADRGQWVVEVAPLDPPRGTRFDFQCWSIVLGDPVVFHTGRLEDSWQLPAQVDYLKAHLAQIEAALGPEEVAQTLARLRTATTETAALPTRAEEARRRRAAPPSASASRDIR